MVKSSPVRCPWQSVTENPPHITPAMFSPGCIMQAHHLASNGYSSVMERALEVWSLGVPVTDARSVTPVSQEHVGFPRPHRRQMFFTSPLVMVPGDAVHCESPHLAS